MKTFKWINGAEYSCLQFFLLQNTYPRFESILSEKYNASHNVKLSEIASTVEVIIKIFSLQKQYNLFELKETEQVLK